METRSATVRSAAQMVVVVLVVLTASAYVGMSEPAAASPTLAVSVTTTVGDERVTAIAPDQPVELHVTWSGFRAGDQDLEIRVRQTDPPSIRTRTETVTGTSGSATFRLGGVLPDQGFDGTQTVALTVSAPGAGPNEEGASASVDLTKAPATMYLTDVPETVQAGDPVVAGYYGWTRMEELPIELTGTSGGETTIIARPSPRFDATAFRGRLRFVPSEYVDLDRDRVLRIQLQSEAVRPAFWSDPTPIEVTNADPKPIITVTPDRPRVGDVIRLDGSESRDPDGEIVSYEWDLDDDGRFETRGRVVELPTNEAGTHRVHLRVADEWGATTTTFRDVFVSEAVTEPPTSVPPTETRRLTTTPEPAGDTVVPPIGPETTVATTSPSTVATTRIRNPLRERGQITATIAVIAGVGAFLGYAGFRRFRRSRIDDGGEDDGKSEDKDEDEDEDESRGLKLVDYQVDTPGDDHENVEQEYLVFENAGDEPVELTGYAIMDQATAEGRAEHEYRFPPGFTLDPGARITVHTGTGRDDDAHLYWGSEWAVWNNAIDTITVTDAAGDVVIEKSYDRTES